MAVARTINPARAFWMGEQTGSIEDGKLADLLVLRPRSSDPYEALLQARIEDIELPAPRIAPPASLSGICSSEPRERASHSYGKSFRDVVRALRGEFPSPPDFVARPHSEAEVVSLLKTGSAYYAPASSVAAMVEAIACIISIILKLAGDAHIGSLSTVSFWRLMGKLPVVLTRPVDARVHYTWPDKIAKIRAVLTLAFLWAIKTGQWFHQLKPIPQKKTLQRPIKSLFRYGLDQLQNVLLNIHHGIENLLFFNFTLKFLSCT